MDGVNIIELTDGAVSFKCKYQEAENEKEFLVLLEPTCKPTWDNFCKEMAWRTGQRQIRLEFKTDSEIVPISSIEKLMETIGAVDDVEDQIGPKFTIHQEEALSTEEKQKWKDTKEEEGKY